MQVRVSPSTGCSGVSSTLASTGGVLVMVRLALAVSPSASPSLGVTVTSQVSSLSVTELGRVVLVLALEITPSTVQL